MTNDAVKGGLERSFANRYRSSGTLGTGAFVMARRRLSQLDSFCSVCSRPCGAGPHRFAGKAGGGHHEAHVPVPTVPRPDLVMIEAEIVPGLLKHCLYGC